MLEYDEVIGYILNLCSDGEINVLNTILSIDKKDKYLSMDNVSDDEILLRSVLVFSTLKLYIKTRKLHPQIFIYLLNNVEIYPTIYYDLVSIKDPYYLQALCHHPKRPDSINKSVGKITALAKAAHMRRFSHIEILLRAGANINVVGISGDPLIIEMSANFTPKMMDDILYIISKIYGIKYTQRYVNTVDLHGCNALYYTLSLWTPITLAMARVLISYGADIQLCNRAGISPQDCLDFGPMLSAYEGQAGLHGFKRHDDSSDSSDDDSSD